LCNFNAPGTHLFIAVDISAMGDTDEYSASVGQLIDDRTTCFTLSICRRPPAPVD